MLHSGAWVKVMLEVTVEGCGVKEASLEEVVFEGRRVLKENQER